MKCLTNNWSCPRPGRRARKAFTFIELVVAIALSVVLLRGMYTIFHSATSLTMLSEQRMVTMLEMAAIFDYIADDVARSPSITDYYYLDIPDPDNSSIMFQAMRLDGVLNKYVYVKYYLDGSDLKREVRGDDMWTPATEPVDGEDGREMTVARNVIQFEAYYFINDTLNDIGDATAWRTGTVGLAGLRTRAVKFVIKINNPAAGPTDLKDQEFTLILPIMY